MNNLGGGGGSYIDNTSQQAFSLYVGYINRINPWLLQETIKCVQCYISEFRKAELAPTLLRGVNRYRHTFIYGEVYAEDMQ